MRKSIFIIALMFGFFYLTSSCATIIHGSKQSVSIASNPSSATVLIDNQEHGKTPLTTKLDRKDHHTVKIELPGYMTYETKFTRKVDGWIAGNIIFGGIIGLAIDAITGGMYKLTPDQIQADLKSNSTSLNTIKDDLFLTVVLNPDPHWEKIGQLIKIN